MRLIIAHSFFYFSKISEPALGYLLITLYSFPSRHSPNSTQTFFTCVAVAKTCSLRLLTIHPITRQTIVVAHPLDVGGGFVLHPITPFRRAKITRLGLLLSTEQDSSLGLDTLSTFYYPFIHYPLGGTITFSADPGGF